MVDTINNGTVVPPFNKGESKAPANTKEAFYVAATSGAEDPISEYDKILQELDLNGYSDIILKAQLDWQDEQDVVKKEYLANVITDPNLSKEEKRQVLTDYQETNLLSKSLQDKYFQNLSQQEILDNNWDASNEDLVTYEVQLNNTKVQQDFSKLLDTASKVLTTNEVVDVASGERTTVAKRIQQVESIEELGDTGGILPLGLDAEFLAYTRMLIGESPIWLDNIIDLFMYDNPDGDDKKTWGEIMEIVEAQNQESWTGEWQEAFDDMLLKMGYNTETINGTFVNKALTTVGEYIQTAAEFINPEDPTKPAVILELVTAFAPVAYGLKKGHARAQAKKTVKSIEKQLDKEVAAAKRAEKKKSRVQSQTPVDPNSPMVTTIATNKKAGTDLVDGVLEDFSGELLEGSKFNIRQLIHYLTDPMGDIVKTTDFGWHVDAARIKELNVNMQRARELQILNPAFADLAQRKQYLTEITNKLNGVVPTIPMVISNTFSIFNPTKSGFNTELAFRKTTTSDYKFRESKNAAQQLREAVGEAEDIFIQEIEYNGTKSRIIKEWNVADKVDVKASQVNGYRVIWKKDSSLYDGYFNGWGETISERFKNSSWLGKKIQMGLFGGAGFSKKTGATSEWFAAYGSLNKNSEYRINVSSLMKQSFLSRQRDIIVRDIANLPQKDRGVLSEVLTYQDKYGQDFVTADTINSIAGATLPTKTLKRIQTAAYQYRRFDKELHYFDNVTYKNMLTDAGYTTAFVIDDTPHAVKADFTVSKTDPILFDEAGNPKTVAIWDFENNREITTFLKPGENTHYVYDADGKIGGQVYRLAKQQRDGSKVYNYATFGKTKAQSLPNNMLPQRPGHVPRIHDEAYTITAYPKYIEIDGKKIDLRKLNTGPTAVLDADLSTTKIAPEKFTKEMAENKASVVKQMAAFGQVISMKNSKADAYRFAGEKIRPSKDTIYVVEKARELQTNQLSDYYVMQERTVAGERLRSDDIDFDIKSDPFATLMENVYTTGARGLDQLAVDQFKMEWVKTFIDNPKITIKDNTTLSGALQTGFGELNAPIRAEANLRNRFPVRAEQIVKVAGNEEFYNAAIKSWNKIYVKEMGYAPGILSTVARHTLDKLGDATEGTQKFGIAKLNKVIREGQKRPASVVSIPLKTVTQFRIMFNTVKQLILQPMAALTPILTVSGGSPIKFAKNIKDVSGLATTYYKETGMFKGKVKKDLDTIIDALWDEDGISTTLEQAKGRVSRKDYQLLLQAAKESGLLDVSDHQFAKGIFVDRIRRLSDSDSILSNVGRKTTEGLQEFGFSSGELINRFGQIIVALRTFEAKNPGKNWRRQEALSQIMYDAYQLSGGMTDITAYGWQRSTPMRFLGQFASFGMKMNEAAWNASATPFNMSQRLQLAAWNVAMWGTAPYALYNIVQWTADMFGGTEEAKEFGRELEKLPISYWMANYFGDYIFGTERNENGEVIKSETIPGEVFGPYGLEPLGVYGVVFKNMMGIWNDNVKTNDMGATINFWKKVGPAYDFMVDVYRNPWDFSLEDRSKLVAKRTAELIPVAKGIINTVIQLSHDTAGRSKTGQEVFGGQTTWESLAQNFLAIPNRSQRDTYEQFKANKTTREFLTEYAQRYIINVYELNPNLTLTDLKEHIVNAKILLEGIEFDIESQEWDIVTDEIMRQALRQQDSMAEILYSSFKKDFSRQPQYRDSEIQRIRELADILKRENPSGAVWLDEQVTYMEEVNEQFNKGK